MSDDDVEIDSERETHDGFILANEATIEVGELHRNYKATSLRKCLVISRSLSPSLDCSIVLQRPHIWSCEKMLDVSLLNMKPSSAWTESHGSF